MPERALRRERIAAALRFATAAVLLFHADVAVVGDAAVRGRVLERGRTASALRLAPDVAVVTLAAGLREE
eukprot:7909639-Lingulodinium_polyedra.AAC.1